MPIFDAISGLEGFYGWFVTGNYVPASQVMQIDVLGVRLVRLVIVIR